MDTPPLTVLDKLVAFVVAVGLLWLLSSPLRSDAPNTTIAMVYSLFLIPMLLIWMARGGAQSGLWEWLPPFWPWGRIASSSFARWLVVGAMVLATAASGAIYILNL